MTQLTELNKISIAQEVVYAPALAIAIVLAIRHGFGRSSGWLYLIIFSLMRMIGAALQLATINDPTNIGLVTGAATVQSVGLSALILVMLGLLNRVLESIREHRDTIVTPRHIRIVQLLVLVALILGIIGGSKMGDIISNAVKSGNLNYTLPKESVIGLALMVAAFGILALVSAMTAFQVSSAAPGEKRLLLAIFLALPFVLVRLIFSAEATFDNNPDFRSFGGTSKYPDLLLGMSVIMEIIAVVILEVVGLTLQKVPKGSFGQSGRSQSVPLGRFSRHHGQAPAKHEHQTGLESV